MGKVLRKADDTNILEKLTDKGRGFHFALPALALAAFHMIVAYAIQGADTRFENGDFIPGLFEGLIGILLYGGLGCCVIVAIVTKRCRYVLEFIGIITAARFILPVIGMIGGGVVISVVIMGCFLIFLSGLLSLALTPILAPIFGVFLGSGIVVTAIVHFLLPIMGVIVIVAMIVGALTGTFEGAGALGRLFTKLIPLL